MNRFRYLKNIDGNSDFIPMDNSLIKLKIQKDLIH